MAEHMVMALLRAERSQREQRQDVSHDPREADAAAQRSQGRKRGGKGNWEEAPCKYKHK